jgi:1-acyl-sn-glycerol-3-phosphate acyltransferase
LLGTFGGLFLVPLNALIQFHAGEHGLGRVLAANNFVQNLVMLGFLGLTVGAALARTRSVPMVTTLGLVALIGALYTLYQLPQSMVRFLVARLLATRYRLQVVGLEHLPAQGGVLMLGNHISWLDWAMLQTASPRPVRFVMERYLYERWYLQWFLDFFGVVPISSRRSKESLETITGLLDAGEVVCLFPEGAISRSGQLGEFKQGFELAAARASGRIVPFYLRGLWGSRFSRAGERLRQARGGGRPRDVVVAFGAPMPMDTQAAAVKQAVFELSVSSWETHVHSFPTLAHAWLETARRHPGQLAVADAAGAVLFSSGSEGSPKGIELSHCNILANVRQVADVLNAEADDTLLANLPLFHAFGLTVTTLLPLLEAIPMVCHPDPTDALGCAKAIARHRVTVLCSTSSFLRLCTRNPRVHPLMLESLRLVVAGAERLSPDVREAFCSRFGTSVYEGYGATETMRVASVNVPDRLDTHYWKVQIGNRPGSVGMPLPGTSFRIVDPHSLEPLPSGQEGMILIGGVQVMKGYLNDPTRTAEAVVELDGKRWYRTGDKGRLDADGFLTIVDRHSRFAKLGGEMISLTQVEELVRRALGQPNLELAATNLPDGRKGERIVLLVVGQVHPESLRKAMLDAGNPPLGIPAEVRRVPSIPKLGSGKTDFKAVRALALAESD